MRNKPTTPNLPTFPLLPAPGAAPWSASAASHEAITRAAQAAASGQFNRAEREARLAERLEKLARSAALAPPAAEPEPELEGELFRLELERRINRFRAEERSARDELKARNPAAWREAYDAARAEALACVDRSWIGDARMFDEPEGGYPD